MKENADTRALFHCKQCGDCCKGFGGTIVTEKDIERIATYIGVDPGRFTDRYCQMSGNRTILAQADNGYCVFWDKNCTIHPVKPKMCRNWPFIPAVLVDVINWHSMASACPGMCTDIADEKILEGVRRELSNL